MSVLRLCRICLQSNKDEMVSVFVQLNDLREEANSELRNFYLKNAENEIVYPSIVNVTINEMIVYFSPKQATSIGELPDKICVDCVQDLITASLFSLRCKIAWYELKKLIHSKGASNINFEVSNNSLMPNETNVNENEPNVNESEDLNDVISLSEESSDSSSLLEPISGTDSRKNVNNSDNDDDSETMMNVYVLEEDTEPEDDVSDDAYSQGSKDNSNGAPENRHTASKVTKHNISQSNRQFECFDCKRAFSELQKLRRHFYGHLYEAPYQCPECPKICKRPIDFHYHLLIHSCEGSRISTDNFIKHAQYCKKIDCKVKSWRSRRKELKKHECIICSKTVTSAFSLKTHMKTHTRTTFDCETCTGKFSSSKELSEHVKAQHPDQWKHLCPKCGKRFRRNLQLNLHMTVHSNERPFKCKYCNKMFSRKHLLGMHERRHLGQKSHFCTHCDMGFYDKFCLDKHIKTHTGERPYQCGYCDKGFVQKPDLRVHLRKHTGERFKCDICEDVFIQLYFLNQHKRKVHGIHIETRRGRVKKIRAKTSGSKIKKV